MRDESAGGAIVNIGSIASEMGTNKGCLVYGTLKAGLDHLTQSLAVELAPDQVEYPYSTYCIWFVIVFSYHLTWNYMLVFLSEIFLFHITDKRHNILVILKIFPYYAHILQEIPILVNV